MKIRVSMTCRMLQEESERLLWSFNGKLTLILTIPRSLGSLLEYHLQEQRKDAATEIRNQLYFSKVPFCREFKLI